MTRPNRDEQFLASEVCVVHTVQRCVRRAFLAGVDEKIRSRLFVQTRVDSTTDGSVGFGVWDRCADLCDLEQPYAPDSAEPAGCGGGLVG